MLERDWPVQVESHSEGKGCWRGTDPFSTKSESQKLLYLVLVCHNAKIKLLGKTKL